MLEALAVIMIVMWLLGLGAGYTLGGLVHLLLVVAVISVIIRVIQGRKILR